MKVLKNRCKRMRSGKRTMPRNRAQNIKASVIIRSYNAEGTIERAVRSALMQNFTEPYEVVVVDDGSTDSTLSIVEKIEDERIVIVHQENSGIVKAANAGVSAAKGSTVVFVDADDEALPDFLASAERELDRGDADIAYSDYFEEYMGEKRHITCDDPFKAPMGAFAWRIESLREAGLFPEGTLFPEYAILLRMWGVWKIAHIAAPAFVYHRSRSSLTGDRSRTLAAIASLKAQYPERSAEINLIRPYDL